jgi:hypothetical protein
VTNLNNEDQEMPTKNYQIDSKSDWTLLFGLDRGQTGTLTAGGRWTWDGQCGRECGPGGNGLPAPGGCPTAGPEGSLIWRISQPRHPGEIDGGDVGAGGVVYMTYFSNDAQSYPINVWGNYEFRMNDNRLDDNSGSLTVTVVTT